MTNKEIFSFLCEQRDKAIEAFQTTADVHPRFQEALATLVAFDFAVYRQQLRQEIIQHVAFWRANNPGAAELVDAVLFEFNSIYEGATEAAAYGIVDWQKPAFEAGGFDMGFDYNFRKGFEAVPGITLSFLQPLEDLLNPATIDELAEPEQEMEEVAGFQSLANAYLFSGLLPIHQVLVDLNQQAIFAEVTLKPDGLFLLGGHDTGVVYPLLTIAAA